MKDEDGRGNPYETGRLVSRMRAGLLNTRRSITICCNIQTIVVRNLDGTVVISLVDQPMFGSRLDADRCRRMCENCRQLVDIGWIVEFEERK